MAATPQPSVLVFDGVCGLCDRLVGFVLKRDRADQFRFAALQSPLGRELVARHGGDPDRLDTVYLVVDRGAPGERALVRSRAVFAILRRLGGIWRVIAWLRILPAPLTDLAYRAVARLRYRVFGRRDACRVPSADERAKFLGVAP